MCSKPFKAGLRVTRRLASGFLILVFSLPCSGQDLPSIGTELTLMEAAELARPALECLQRPYPYKPGHVLVSDSDAVPPRVQHPAFYGCFDWHSSVHGHWTLVKLLKAFPELPEGDQIREKLSQNLTADNLEKETAFFYSEGNKTFERTYGWSWLLELAFEMATWDDPLGKELYLNLKPLADSLVVKYSEFLEILPYPIRVGEHTNTAFGLAFAWDYASHAGDAGLLEVIERRSRDYYLGDRGCPVDWEPGGFDFISPCLMEADLMSRILDEREFSAWLKDFLPGILDPDHFQLSPARVTDRSDPKIVHLDGLNLSRAWNLFHISNKLQRRYPHLTDLAWLHLNASLPHIASGHYEGEHWLASFAVYAQFSQFE
jgi:hypothetical protein